MAQAPHLRAGQQAERQALEHLQAHGLETLASNWRCARGELDLVMLDDDTVVFVEVRYRLHAQWGGALSSIDRRKQEKLVLTAQHFLVEHAAWAEHPCRFDVVALEGSSLPSARLNWIRNAFDS